MKPEIFVLNYNGRDLLIECLPSILTAAAQSPVACPVTVIDNQSTDDSLNVLKNQFPAARIYISPKNTVLCAFNEVVRQSSADVVMLLNSDLKADPGFVAPLLRVFADHPDAFMAGPKTFTFDGSQYEGSLSKLFFCYGLPGAQSRFAGFEQKIDRPGFTMQSGFGAFHRDRFLELGGYDDLYLPGTVEDMDICWRAWKAGYACYYASESRMSHKGQATFRKNFSRSRILAVNQRNLYLFTWKNISDPGLILRHLVWFLIRPLWFLLQGRFEFAWGCAWAFSRLSEVLKKRSMVKKIPARRSDREILNISRAI